MFVGLMNSIDQRRLTFCQEKLKDIRRLIVKASAERDSLKVAQKSLRQNKRAGASCGDVYCNRMWVDIHRVDGLIEEVESRIDDLTRVQYEKFGTKCANLSRRIATRDAKIAGRQLSGSSIV